MLLMFQHVGTEENQCYSVSYYGQQCQWIEMVTGSVTIKPAASFYVITHIKNVSPYHHCFLNS